MAAKRIETHPSDLSIYTYPCSDGIRTECIRLRMFLKHTVLFLNININCISALAAFRAKIRCLYDL